MRIAALFAAAFAPHATITTAARSAAACMPRRRSVGTGKVCEARGRLPAVRAALAARRRIADHPAHGSRLRLDLEFALRAFAPRRKHKSPLLLQSRDQTGAIADGRRARVAVGAGAFQERALDV